MAGDVVVGSAVLTGPINAAGNKVVSSLSTIELLLLFVIGAGSVLAIGVIRALWKRFTDIVDTRNDNDKALALALNDLTNALERLEAKIK